MNSGRGGDNQNKQELQNVRVKQKMYSRWKPVAPESIRIALDALEAAVGFVKYVHYLDHVKQVIC